MKLRKRLIGGAIALATVFAPWTVGASSHREAPFITKNPKIDGTDFYMFNSFETGRTGYVTILANYLPLQDAYGGPNYFGLDPDAIYEIHIDNDGDAVEDLTFQFDFDSVLSGDANTGIALNVGPNGSTKSVSVPFAAVGGLSAADESARNILDTYEVNLIRGARRTGTSAAISEVGSGTTTFKKPIDYIGTKTIANYTAYASSFQKNITIPGCTPTGVDSGTSARMFVGQRQEAFAVNLGQIFDLVNVDTEDTNNIANVVGAPDQGRNTIAGKNVTTIALEVPASCLVGATPIIGAWTTASVRQARVINPTATYTQPSREGGPWVQVSRLGNPLVNEVVIGLKDKDRFNSSEPKNDGQFADYVTNPTLPVVLELLFGGIGVRAPTNYPRTDLVTAFLTGVPSVNANGATAEYLRLNTTAALTTPQASQSPYGAVGCFDDPTASAGAMLDLTNTDCDPAGFPNGRRPGDDVTDIAIRVAMGALVDRTSAVAAGCLHANSTGCLPYVDGAQIAPTALPATFPYLAAPTPGAP